MAVHAIANAVNASRAAALRTKYNALTALEVAMPRATLTTYANTVRERRNAALQTNHGTIRHIECEQNSAEHCAAMKDRGHQHYERTTT